MPEAVASNSISVPDRQLPKIDMEAFEDAIQQLDAFSFMLGPTLDEATGIRGDISCGITKIIDQQITTLKDVWKAVDVMNTATNSAKPERGRTLISPIDPDLAAAVSNAVCNAMQNNGYDLDMADATSWPAEASRAHSHAVWTLYSKLIERLGTSTDLIEAASLLPWVEVLAQKEFEERADEHPSLLRDQFVSDSVQKGFAAADIAQALGLSSTDVERIIVRLTADPSPLRAAV